MREGLSYRQLRSLRSLTGGYDYIALRAGNAVFGGYVAQLMGTMGGEDLTVSCFLMLNAELFCPMGSCAPRVL